MKKIFTTLAVMAACYFSNAQSINYHDVNPDTTINTWEVFGALGVDIWWHPSPEVVVKTWGVELLCGTDSMPKALKAGDSISAVAGLWTELNYQCLNCGGVQGNWKGTTDRYLGVRDKDASGNWNYGWIRLDIPANASGFTIKDYAENTAANTGIKAGQAFATGIATYAAQSNIKKQVSGREVSFAGLKTATHLSVTDMSGKTVLVRDIQEKEKIDLSAWPAALYILNLETTEGTQRFKLPVQ